MQSSAIFLNRKKQQRNEVSPPVLILSIGWQNIHNNSRKMTRTAFVNY